MAELDSAALRKRQAWAEKQDTATYIDEMGSYAVARDASIVRALLGKGSGRCLDLPCGTGRFLELEKELGYKVTAADYSPTMMGVAQQHKDVTFVQADAFKPPFEPGTFEAILVIRLLFHYGNPEVIIEALARCLAPGGRIVFDTLNPLSLRYWASKVIQVFRRDPARRLYFVRPGAMKCRLRAFGLKVVRTQGAYVFPTRFYRYLPKWFPPLVDLVEKLIPRPLRVLTFWQVVREDEALSGR